MPRMPSDSFERFVALGDGRSYARLAEALGVSKRSVTARATKEGWQARLQRIDAAAAEKFDEKAANETSVVNDRHLRCVRAMQHKALAALQNLSLNSGMDAIRALDLAIKAERVILGKTGAVDGLNWADVVADIERRRQANAFTVFTGVSSRLPDDG